MNYYTLREALRAFVRGRGWPSGKMVSQTTVEFVDWLSWQEGNYHLPLQPFRRFLEWRFPGSRPLVLHNLYYRNVATGLLGLRLVPSTIKRETARVRYYEYAELRRKMGVVRVKRPKTPSELERQHAI